MLGLRSELEGMKMSALKRRAKSVGIDEDGLDLILDADDPKTAAVEAIVLASPSPRHELEGLRLSSLKQRAVSVGIDEGGLDEILDADDPKAAAIEAILSAEAPVNQPLMTDGARLGHLG